MSGTGSAGGEQTPAWDFFVSYTAVDRPWAEWVSWQLEAAGYRVLVQAWDFVPGSNWAARMQQGIVDAQRTIALLSAAYLSSAFGQEEWQAARAADPSGFDRRLLPLRVEDCERPGLLGQIVSIDLFGHPADAARKLLLDGVTHALEGRAKPATEPTFPGSARLAGSVPEPDFPGTRHLRGSVMSVWVGQGAGAQAPVFEAAYAAAGGSAKLGVPVSEVTPEGPGLVQYLGEGADGKSAVVCTVAPDAAVVVAASVWHAVRTGAGSGHVGVSEIGLPVPGRLQPSVGYVDRQATVVELAGGSWGPGSLVREGRATAWTWQPDARVGFEIAENRRWWSSTDDADLRVRAVAVFSWLLGDAQTEIVKAGRERMAAAVVACELANAAPVLTLRRGGRVAAPGWERATGFDSFQTDRSAHLRSVLRAGDGSPALSTEVIAQVVHGLELPNVRTCAELRVGFAAWRSVLGEGGGPCTAWDPRLAVQEVAEVLAAAWSVATLVAPLAVVDDPRAVPPLGVPYVEFHIQAMRQPGAGRSPVLADVVDLGPFGEPAQECARQGGGMRIVAPVGLDRPRRSALVCEGLARLARSWSYIDADQDQLLTLMWG